MTAVLERAEDLVGTRPSDTAISTEGLFALRTRRRSPEHRMAQRVQAELEMLNDVTDATLTSDTKTYWELERAVHALGVWKDLTSAGRRETSRLPADMALPTSAQYALDALGAVTRYLRISETDAAGVVGISRNTIRGWREGRAPYPATTRRLFQLANLLDAVARTGVNIANWIDEPTPTGALRRDLLRQEDGASALARDAASLLFGSNRVHTLAAELPDAFEADEEETKLPPPEFNFRAPRERRRKPR